MHCTHAIVSYLALTAFSVTSAFADSVLYIDDSSGNLGTVDLSNGEVHVIGQMPTVMTDIAFSPERALYGIDFQSNLWQIDVHTASANIIGSTGEVLNSLVFGSDGSLYAASQLTRGVYSLNTTTGVSTFLGDTGNFSAGDLAFYDGELYLSASPDRLVRIEQGTYTGTVVGSLGYFNVYGMATGDGTLYGVSDTTVFQIDPSTSETFFVLDYAGSGLGSANGTSFSREAIPEPSSVLFVLAGLSVTAFQVLRVKHTL